MMSISSTNFRPLTRRICFSTFPFNHVYLLFSSFNLVVYVYQFLPLQFRTYTRLLCLMDDQLQAINQRADDDISNSSNKETRKMDGERKCPSHVIDVTCDEFLVENQRECRICHLNAKESGGNSVELIELGCGCKGELGVAHLRCAEAWFRVRGYRMCEICSETAKNITGVGDIQFMEEWRESQSPTGGSRRWLSGQLLCSFLMAFLVIAVALPWFFRVNIL